MNFMKGFYCNSPRSEEGTVKILSRRGVAIRTEQLSIHLLSQISKVTKILDKRKTK